MKILCTHPGRYGDLLWALPTVRALSFTIGGPVDLLLSPKYSRASFRALLERQLYIGSVTVAKDWEVLETAPMTPREPPSIPSGYDQVVHLGYEGWPRRALPWEIFALAEKQTTIAAQINLDVPWIAPSHQLQDCHLVVGFTDEHFELKYGLYGLLRQSFLTERLVNICGQARWKAAGYHCDWEAAANWLGATILFVGCCSALHVLACAVGTPVVLLEPNPMRHHDVFYPFGKLGPQVHLVLGLDGLPTFDSRHLIGYVGERLARRARGVRAVPR